MFQCHQCSLKLKNKRQKPKQKAANQKKNTKKPEQQKPQMEMLSMNTFVHPQIPTSEYSPLEAGKREQIL